MCLDKPSLGINQTKVITCVCYIKSSYVFDFRFVVVT